MANYEDYFCNHCKCTTTFSLQSDLLWYCDECDNVLGSCPDDDTDDFDFEEINTEFVKCPVCNRLVNIGNLDEEYLCLNCATFLGDEIEKKGYSYDDELGKYVKA